MFKEYSSSTCDAADTALSSVDAAVRLLLSTEALGVCSDRGEVGALGRQTTGLPGAWKDLLAAPLRRGPEVTQVKKGEGYSIGSHGKRSRALISRPPAG